jgi:hypothetical protein
MNLGFDSGELFRCREEGMEFYSKSVEQEQDLVPHSFCFRPLAVAQTVAID